LNKKEEVMEGCKKKFGDDDCMVEVARGGCVIATNTAGCNQFTDFAKQHPVPGIVFRVHAEIANKFKG
jgi:hypothetical protein